MFSRLNMLSITGLKDPEKCGKTLSENAATSSALYCERKMETIRHRSREEGGEDVKSELFHLT